MPAEQQQGTAAAFLPIGLFARQAGATRERERPVEPRQRERKVAAAKGTEPQVAQVQAGALCVAQPLADCQRRRVVTLRFVETAQQQKDPAQIAAGIAGPVRVFLAGLFIERQRPLVALPRSPVFAQFVQDEAPAVEGRGSQIGRAQPIEDRRGFLIGLQGLDVTSLQPAHLPDVAERPADLLLVGEGALQRERLLVKTHRALVVAEVLVTDADVAQHDGLAVTIAGFTRRSQGLFKQRQRGLRSALAIDLTRVCQSGLHLLGRGSGRA